MSEYDLVEHLRNPAFYVTKETPAKEQLLVLIHGMEGLCRQAANEIERLRDLVATREDSLGRAVAQLAAHRPQDAT